MDVDECAESNGHCDLMATAKTAAECAASDDCGVANRRPACVNTVPDGLANPANLANPQGAYGWSCGACPRGFETSVDDTVVDADGAVRTFALRCV